MITKMSGDRHFTRIDLGEIKIHIGKKVGNQKAEKYFSLLDRYFSMKLGKSEFDKLCIATIGRENICLHNRLIRSILKNVCLSEVPPPKLNKFERPVVDKVANGYQRSCIQSLCRDAIPQSPKRGRTAGIRERKSKDRPSPLGPHGKPNALASKESGLETLEQQSPTELLSMGSRPVEPNSVEDGEEVDQAAISPGIHSRSPVTPPLGVPWNGKGNRKMHCALLSSAVRVETCHGTGELPDSSSLRKRLEQKLEKEGLGISLDSVDVLNNGVDVFLKRLIKPSLELARSRVGSYRQQNTMIDKVVSGPNGAWPVRYSHGSPTPISASMLDFRTAMELNPKILGENWPILLEKVCLQECESRDSE